MKLKEIRLQPTMGGHELIVTSDDDHNKLLNIKNNCSMVELTRGLQHFVIRLENRIKGNNATLLEGDKLLQQMVILLCSITKSNSDGVLTSAVRFGDKVGTDQLLTDAEKYLQKVSKQ